MALEMMRRAVVVLIALSVALCTLAACTAAELPARGTRVRIRLSPPAEPGWLTGEFAGASRDSLLLRLDRSGIESAVPRSSVRALEISRGRHRRTGRGAFLGFITGTATGIFTGVVLCQSSQECHDNHGDSLFDGDNTGLVAFVLGIGGAVAGTTIGALVGTFIHSEKWAGTPFVAARPERPGRAPGELRAGVSFHR